MEALASAGHARLLGVSNVSPEQVEALLSHAQIPPAFVQNRCYARDGWDARVRAICRANDIVYQGFSLLTANRSVWEHPRTRAIASRLHATEAQVIFALARALGILPLTGTTDPAHMRADLAAHAITLTTADQDTLLALR
jgi:diketogulonate reductase-like aldo/keto reductase